MDDVAIYYGTALTPKNMLDVADCAGAALGIDFNLLDRQLTPMACETEEAYLVQTSTSIWYSIDLVTGTDGGGVADNYNAELNAGGYNLTDDRIWGNAFNGKLFAAVKDAVTGAWTVQTTGVIPGLPTGGPDDEGGLFTGDVNAAGELIMYSGVGGSQDVYVVDVNPGSATYLTVIRTFKVNLGASVTMYDWALNPIDGKLYGVSGYNGNLYQVDPATGTSVNLGASGAPAGSFYGAVYFDDRGFFYASSNSTGNIYRIDLRTSPGTNYDETKTVLFSVSGASAANDGMRCAKASMPIDFGDAPDTATGNGTGNYQTLLADDGPRHGIIGFVQATNTAKLSLGPRVTVEVDGLPNADATGDVDDGVTWPSLLILGESYSVPVTLVNQTGANAYLNAWIDYNRDGVFAAGEQVATEQVVANGATAASIAFTVPTTGVVLNGTPTFARVRLCSRALDCNLSTGPAFGGEVEDHGYILLTGPDYDDLPASYGTYKANGGARHLITQMAAAFGSPGTTTADDRERAQPGGGRARCAGDQRHGGRWRHLRVRPLRRAQPRRYHRPRHRGEQHRPGRHAVRLSRWRQQRGDQWHLRAKPELYHRAGRAVGPDDQRPHRGALRPGQGRWQRHELNHLLRQRLQRRLRQLQRQSQLYLSVAVAPQLPRHGDHLCAYSPDH